MGSIDAVREERTASMKVIAERGCPRRDGGGSEHVIVRSCSGRPAGR